MGKNCEIREKAPGLGPRAWKRRHQWKKKLDDNSQGEKMSWAEKVSKGIVAVQLRLFAGNRK